MRILSNLNIVGTLDLDNVQNAAADTDRFLVQDANGIVKFRTGAEVASDIGASVGFVSTVKHEVKLGEAISKGQAVYVSTADGTNMIVSKASNASEATSSKTMGILETGGILNDKVFVVTEGLVAGLNTSTATIGDPVWLGTNGNLLYGLANKPVAPSHMVFIGIVTRVNLNNGEIFVKVQNGFELQELHNVLITGTPVDKSALLYDLASGLWKNSIYGALIASGTSSQIFRGDGSLYNFPLSISSPISGQTLRYDGANWVNSSDAFQIDYDVSISGSRNSVNKVFTLSTNFVSGTTRVFVNGIRYTSGATYDYVETGTNQITFTNAPDNGDLLIVEYIKL